MSTPDQRGTQRAHCMSNPSAPAMQRRKRVRTDHEIEFFPGYRVIRPQDFIAPLKPSPGTRSRLRERSIVWSSDVVFPGCLGVVVVPGDIEIDGSLFLSPHTLLDVRGDITLTGGLHSARGSVECHGRFTADYVEVDGFLTVHGSVSITRNLQVTGVLSVRGDLSVEGNARVRLGDYKGRPSRISGNARVGKKLDAIGLETLGRTTTGAATTPTRDRGACMRQFPPTKDIEQELLPGG
jgi:hypothetical protein